MVKIKGEKTIRKFENLYMYSNLDCSMSFINSVYTIIEIFEII